MNDEDWKKVAVKNIGKHVEYVNGVYFERERIIALLADKLTEFTYTDEDGQPHWLNGDSVHDKATIAALIKGENNE